VLQKSRRLAASTQQRSQDRSGSASGAAVGFVVWQSMFVVSQAVLMGGCGVEGAQHIDVDVLAQHADCSDLAVF
jgi:hypothetical protein